MQSQPSIPGMRVYADDWRGMKEADNLSLLLTSCPDYLRHETGILSLDLVRLEPFTGTLKRSLSCLDVLV